MGFKEGYQGYLFRQVNPPTPYHKGGWNFEGHVDWTLPLARVRDAATWELVLEEWNTKGYKIGLRIADGQEIRELVYGGVTLAPLPEGVADLNASFGTLAGHRWVAFGGRGTRHAKTFLEPNGVSFEVKLRMGDTVPDVQILASQSRHLDGSFVRSMPGSWVLRRHPV
jgi:hypothetical protein